MSAKSQFLTNSGFSSSDYLLGSLTVSVADTRVGFDNNTAKLVDNMVAFADATSNGRRMAEYVAKISPQAKATVAPRSTAKFNNNGGGMM